MGVFDDSYRNAFEDISFGVDWNPSSISVTSSSVANPSVITTATAHGYVTGDKVNIAGHTGSTPDINGNHTVTVTDSTHFTIPVNVTVGGTGGTVVRIGRQVLADKANFTNYVQAVIMNVTTSASVTGTFADTAGSPLTFHATPAAPGSGDFVCSVDFGPKGVALTEGKGFRLDLSTRGLVFQVLILGYRRQTAVIAA